MKNKLIAALALSCAFPFTAAMAATYTFSDAFSVALAEADPDTAFNSTADNFPRGQRLSVDGGTGDFGGGPGAFASQGLVRFDDFALSSGDLVTSATLVFSTVSATRNSVSVHQMLTSFDTTSTWNSFGGGLTSSVDYDSTPSDLQGNIPDDSTTTFNVTAIVESWATGASAFGFAFLNSGDDGWDFVTEDGRVNGPRLIVETRSVPTPDPNPAPIPLPASGLLLMGAFAGLAAVRRRKQA